MTRTKQIDELAKPKTTISCNIARSSGQNQEQDTTISHEDENEQQSNNNGSVANIIASVLAANRQQNSHNDDKYDLRPKFAILKHKSELLNAQQVSALPNSNNHRRRAYPKTPDWFFNIPTTRSPFPDFGSKLSSNQDELDDES